MNIRKKVIAGITVMLLGIGNTWAATSPNELINANKPILLKAKPPGLKPGRPPKPDKPPRAPEIDAASGTSAIALLTGVLLLAGERSRSRRS